MKSPSLPYSPSAFGKLPTGPAAAAAVRSMRRVSAREKKIARHANAQVGDRMRAAPSQNTPQQTESLPVFFLPFWWCTERARILAADPV